MAHCPPPCRCLIYFFIHHTHTAPERRCAALFFHFSAVHHLREAAEEAERGERRAMHDAMSILSLCQQDARLRHAARCHARRRGGGAKHALR